MTENTNPPEEVAPPSPEQAFLVAAKADARAAIVAHLDGLKSLIDSKYPRPEQDSYPYQRPEALAVVAAGDAATLGMAPLLERVCFYQFGEATPAVRLEQVKVKAAGVAVLAEQLLEAAAFTNGTRARADEEIAAAETLLQVLELKSTYATLIEDFRSASGF